MLVYRRRPHRRDDRRRLPRGRDVLARARGDREPPKPRLVSYDLTARAGGRGRARVRREDAGVHRADRGHARSCACSGPGHVAQPLARMAKAAGFRVEVADDRVKFANARALPGGRPRRRRRLRGRRGAHDAGPATPTRSSSRAATRATRRRSRRRSGKGLRFVGLLGSRPKVVHIVAALEERGVAPRTLARIHAPLGLEIGAADPGGDRGQHPGRDDRRPPWTRSRSGSDDEDGAARPARGRPNFRQRSRSKT